jgi:large subunit ribosomal protein L13
MKTAFAKPERVRRDWYLVDASGKTLGRLATQIAMRLRGKHKPEFTPHVDCGDHIIVINAEKVAVTGNKAEGREYTYYTGYPGGLRHVQLGAYREQNPEELIKLAVRRMLPKNRIGRTMLSRLKVYRGPLHPHTAQQPQPWNPTGEAGKQEN